MSWTLNMSGHCADEAKMEAVLGEIRALGYSLDALADRDAGDTFGGSFSGPNVSVSFPEPVTAVADEMTDAQAAELAGPDAETEAGAADAAGGNAEG